MSETENDKSTETTSITTKIKSNEQENSGETGEVEVGDVYEAAEIAVPFAITVTVILVLCVTVVYAKLRKNRLRRLGLRGAQMPSIAGGVPMNTGAFQNQAFHVGYNTTPHSNVYSEPPPMYSGHESTVFPETPVYQPPLPSYSEAPPKYEEIHKHSSGNETIVNMGTNNVRASMQPAPSDEHNIVRRLNETNNERTQGNISPTAQEHSSNTITYHTNIADSNILNSDNPSVTLESEQT